MTGIDLRNNMKSGGESRGAEPLVRGAARCPPAVSRLRVEKIEGGLLVAGFVVAANCQVVLPIFGFLFMLVGCVLTAASYRGCGANEQPDHYAARIAFTGNSRVLGPVCIVAGAIMTLAGVALCMLMRAAQRRQRRLAFHCPIHGDFYPLSPEATRKTSVQQTEPKRSLNRLRRWLGLDGRSHAPREPPRCPRSTEKGSPAAPDAPCPPPLPFLVPSDSIVGMASVLGAPLSPEQTFGSIRSLAISREVASFPMSRTPSPPPLRELSCELENFCGTSVEDAVNVPNMVPPRPVFDCGSPTCTFRVVECKLTTTNDLNHSVSGNAKAVTPSEIKVETKNEEKDSNNKNANAVTISMPIDSNG